jgi:microcystin degradation protein MlrC
MSEELCEESIIPSGAFDFALDGALFVIGFDDVEGELAQEGEVLRAVAGAVSGSILAHGNIEHPVEVVFDMANFYNLLHFRGDRIYLILEEI